jgi:hypothetical protein
MPPFTNSRGTESERFWKRVRILDNGCWQWIGGKDKRGYGRFALANAIPHQIKLISPHVYAYTRYVGPIPNGLELDHLCRFTSCVNPLHLEPVTHQINMLRGTGPVAQAAKKTHCLNGHLLDEENTYIAKTGARYCRACKKLRRQKAKATNGNQPTTNRTADKQPANG